MIGIFHQGKNFASQVSPIASVGKNLTSPCDVDEDKAIFTVLVKIRVSGEMVCEY